jgi:hypothetical protein
VVLLLRIPRITVAVDTYVADPLAAQSEARALNARTVGFGFDSRLGLECLCLVSVALSSIGTGLATSRKLVHEVLSLVEGCLRKQNGGQSPHMSLVTVMMLVIVVMMMMIICLFISSLADDFVNVRGCFKAQVSYLRCNWGNFVVAQMIDDANVGLR